MKSLESNLEQVIIALAGKELSDKITIEESHLDVEVKTEYQALVKALGTNKLFQLYNTKEGIKLAKPFITLSIATGKVVVNTMGGVKTVALKNLTVAGVGIGSQIGFEFGEGEDTEYYSLSVRSTLKPGTEGVIPASTLQKSPESVLQAGGFYMDAEGDFKGVVKNTYKKDNNEEVHSYVAAIDAVQVSLGYNVSEEAFKKLAVYTGKIKISDGMLTAGDIAISLDGFLTIEKLPVGRFNITGHRQEQQNWQGKTWMNTIAITSAGEVKLKGNLGKVVINQSTGDNLVLSVEETKDKAGNLSKSGKIEFVEGMSDDIVNRFKGVFADIAVKA